MKFYGLYTIRVDQMQEISFILTDNMIGHDEEKVFRSFDLKGSTHGRIEKISDEDLKNGTGMKVLKDLNLIKLNKDGKMFKIDE